MKDWVTKSKWQVLRNDEMTADKDIGNDAVSLQHVETP
jgi:hypothetical protein